MRRTVITKSAVLKSICSKVSFSVTTFSVLRPSLPSFTTKLSLEFVMFVTLIKKWTFLNYPQAKSLKPPGTVKWFSLDVWPSLKSISLTLSPTPLSLIRLPLPQSPLPVTHQSFAAPLFALTWAAFPFPTWEPTKVGCASATVPSTISSAAWDKVPPPVTCLTLTIRCTDPSSALRSRSSPTSPVSSSTSESVQLVYGWRMQ